METVYMGEETGRRPQMKSPQKKVVNQPLTRATTEVQHFFAEVPQFGNLRPLPKTDLKENKTTAGR